MTPRARPLSVTFDSGPLGSGSYFSEPSRAIEAWEPDEVVEAFHEMEAARAQGKWLVGAAGYELGYALIPKIAERMPKRRSEPLLRFGVFDDVYPVRKAPVSDVFSLDPFVPSWDEATYGNAFTSVHNYLASGDIYQANLTFSLTSQLHGCPYALYEHLKMTQPVPHGAFVDLGGTKLLSRSPELFFSLSADGEIRARPMKGTIHRSADAAEDAELRDELAASEKNQAENLMITDLLRNDIGRIAQIGTVHVPQLFAIESYATVHQMTSEVVAKVVPKLTLKTLFEALFPCGSITGAPKIRAMEILSELEDSARNAYCGAIGWISPDGAMEFNVAIRTLACAPSGHVTLNVGGGIVYDSTAKSEYREALLKAKFAQLS